VVVFLVVRVMMGLMIELGRQGGGKRREDVVCFFF
jgi:hypothetical protein